MSARNVLESQQSVQAPSAGRTAAGCWKLNPGRALSLHPRQRSVLEIAQGRVWLTVSGASPADALGAVADHVLQAGDRISIAAGQHVVMEAWAGADAPQADVAFRWDGAGDQALALAADPRTPRAAAEWDCSVVQPLRDLLQALGQGGRAVGLAGVQVLSAGSRLALGIARFALFRIAAPRERRPA